MKLSGFGGREQQQTTYRIHNVTLAGKNSREYTIKCVEVPTITGVITYPKLPEDILELANEEDVNIGTAETQRKIHILIGIDNYDKLIDVGKEKILCPGLTREPLTIARKPQEQQRAVRRETTPQG
ncbi:hypothetical protein SNEBB_010777 [Seison nebaliae]|nr:hypothetical protein SNEBB_010777 [Seison nebaliae]